MTLERTPIGPGAKSLARGTTFSAEPKPLKRTTELKPGAGDRRRNSTLSQGDGFAASKAQRDKVATQVCIVCQAEHCDPAHLAPRTLGRGCDHRNCVVALCRRHHEQFDRGDLDLLPHISGAGFEVELAHMQGHYSDPLSVVIRLSGHRWIPDPSRVIGGTDE